MAGEDKKQPIVIKKVIKKGGGHHGGSWKVAYADFVTAMMAFFLLLWLLGISDEKLREGISDWFQNPSAIQGPGGASTSLIKLGGTKDIPRGEGRKAEQHAPDVQPEKQDQKIEDKVREVVRQQDKKQLDRLLQKLKAAIKSSDQLKNFKDQLLLEITPEGLRVQIVDKKNRPMFDLGSDQLKSYTREILQNISKVIAANVPNKVSIAGHTDATPFPKGYIEYEDQYGNDYRKPYSNWELSADRANAARRELVEAGMPSNQLGRVVGLADSVLFNKDNPYSPVNRRISIIVLNKDAEQALLKGEGKMNPAEANSDSPASQ